MYVMFLEECNLFAIYLNGFLKHLNHLMLTYFFKVVWFLQVNQKLIV